MFSAIASLAGAVLPKIFDVVDKSVTDKDEAAKLKNDIQRRMLEMDAKELESATKIIVAEAGGESSVQREWRPHLMYLIMGLLVFNGVLVPLGNWGAALAGYTISIPILEAWEAIPTAMWTLLQIGVGGYVVGRSAEKGIKSWKKSS